MDPTSNSPHSNHSSYQRVPSLTSGLISEDTIISPGPSEPLRSNRKHSQYDDDDQEGNPVSSMPLHDEIPYGPQPPVLHTTATFTFTHPLKPILLQLLTTLSTILFTVLPVVIKAGPDATWGQWYSWRDACRLLEPFFSGLLHSWFFYSSDLMRRWPSSSSSSSSLSPCTSASYSNNSYSHYADIPLADRPSPSSSSSYAHNHSLSPATAPSSPSGRSSKQHSLFFKSLLSSIFTFFLIFYVTGAALHTAAAFFKNVVSIFLDLHSQGIGLSTHAPTAGDGLLSLKLAQELKQGYLLIQDVWEHNISHYMYAFGALGMSWCEMIAYSGQVLPAGVNLARVGRPGPVNTKDHRHQGRREEERDPEAVNGTMTGRSSKRLVFLWILAGVLYGGIVAGVACQYPKGLYVGSAYVLLLLLVLSSYLFSTRKRSGGIFTLGRNYILQTYLIGGVVAAVAIIIYMAIHHFDMLTSNDKSHLGSITRP